MSFAKTTLPAGTTRKGLLTSGATLPVKLGDRSFVANVREFSTGSIGFNVSDKMELVINGQTFKAQIGLNVTLVGTKDLPKEGV